MHLNILRDNSSDLFYTRTLTKTESCIENVCFFSQAVVSQKLTVVLVHLCVYMVCVHLSCVYMVLVHGVCTFISHICLIFGK